MKFNYHIPTKILFGAGRFAELASAPLPGKKALIVTTEGTVKRGICQKAVDYLKKQGIESIVFAKVLPNPILDHVTEAAILARKESCDFVIGLGGGSAMDTSKAVAVMGTNEGSYWDYIHGGSGKGKSVKNPPLPIVTVTTTAATGTECDPWTVITKTDTNEKIGFGLIPQTFPLLSIVDPELSFSVPPALTAYQGFDVLFHATEGYLNKTSYPISDMYSLKSIAMISKHLPTAVKNGTDLEARSQVMLANLISGMVESTSGCISMHSMEHALSGFYPDLTHGAGLLMLSVSYYSFWVNHAPERMRDMAEAMGEDVRGLSAKEGALKFVEALKKLQKACGVDNLKMSTLGIKKDEMPKMAKKAMDDMGGLFDVDPKKLTMDETVKIMEESWS